MLLKLTESGDLPLPKGVHRTLMKQADLSGHEECCGLLLGKVGQVGSAVAAENVHPTPRTHFEIDPQALIDAHRAEREGGPQVLGYYHSHPLGSSMPSDTDRASSARDGKVWAIIGYDGLRFWLDAPDGFRALSYQVIGP